MVKSAFRRAALSVLLLLCFSLSACPAYADDTLSWQGTLTLGTIFEPDDYEGELVSAPLACFDKVLAQWQALHPGIRVEVQQRSGELAALGRLDRLPDLFISSGLSGLTFAKFGLLCDLSEAVTESVYADRYDMSALLPFYCFGRVAAFPVLARSFSVVIYDAAAFEQAGFAAFPSTWEELRSSVESFSALGYKDLLAYGNNNGRAVARDLLSPLLVSTNQTDWLMQLVNRDPDSMFLDQSFLDIMTIAREMLNDGVFCADCDTVSADAAVSLFLDGKCPALLTYGDDVFRALDQAKEDSPELYDRLGFAALPLPEDIGGGKRFMTSGINYGLYVSGRTGNDPDKLAACLDLCRYLTGPAYADALMTAYGRHSFTVAQEDALTQFVSNCDDPVLMRLVEYTKSGMTPCLDVTSMLHSAVWGACASGLGTVPKPSLWNTEKIESVERVANTMQDMYERYYLNIS